MSQSESYLLIKEIQSVSKSYLKCGYPVGCIFECETSLTKLICRDNHTLCDKPEIILANSVVIDEKCARLLLGITRCGQRVKLYQCDTWKTRSTIDVGDKCKYTLSGQPVDCTVVSKQLLENNGYEFTVILSNGRKINTSIEKLSDIPKNKPPTNLTLPISKPTNSNIPRQQTNSTDKVNHCKCLEGIFQRAEVELLDMSIEEKETFFRNLFTVLPTTMPLDSTGRHSIHWAAMYLLTESINFWLNKEPKSVHYKDCDGNTAFHLAVDSPVIQNNKENSRIKQNLIKTVTLFLNHGFDVGIKNNKKETVIVRIFKLSNFELLEKLLVKVKAPLVLSDHVLTDNSSFLEYLIKLKMFTVTNHCVTKIKQHPNEDELILKAAVVAVNNGNIKLACELIKKSDNQNYNLSNGETILTTILKDTVNVDDQAIDYVINNLSLDYSQKNIKGEHPLLLACQRFFIGLVKEIINHAKFINEELVCTCIEATITTYSNYLINQNYKTNVKSNLSPTMSSSQYKQIAFSIIENLLSTDVNIDIDKVRFKDTLKGCMDTTFTRAVKQLCRVKNRSSVESPSFETKSNPQIPSNDNKYTCCPMCLDNPVDCSFQCGHTCCFQCGNQIVICHACRQNITERRKIYLS